MIIVNLVLEIVFRIWWIRCFFLLLNMQLSRKMTNHLLNNCSYFLQTLWRTRSSNQLFDKIFSRFHKHWLRASTKFYLHRQNHRFNLCLRCTIYRYRNKPQCFRHLYHICCVKALLQHQEFPNWTSKLLHFEVIDFRIKASDQSNFHVWRLWWFE